MSHRQLTALKWTGTVTGIIGATLIALNISISGYGFLFYGISCLTWGVAGWWMREWSLVVLQGVFLIINVIGIWRWLIL
ncbi:MAG: hypothetical protein HQL50_10155 [Magnetococcales bacterium]|nr:hypothetical protein [Magnetococcales bacterium]